jgi:Fe(3+) dicitrate transport protein
MLYKFALPGPWLSRSIFRFVVLSVAVVGLNKTANSQTAESGQVVVTGAPVASPTPYDNWKEKRDHLMPEVSGTQITVTKKATVIKLDQQPPIQNNNLQEEFTKAPGLLVTEQNNPGQFNFSYRGLGNPQESEYIMVMQDGLPLMAEWIGFPTLYYLPVPQSVSEIQVIRGGSSLLYGPEPAPVVNFVMKHPALNTPWNAYVEQTGGSYGTYASHAAVQEASGPVEIRLDGSYLTSEGQRDNGDYNLWQANAYLGYRPDENQLSAVDVHVSRFDGNDPGRLTLAQFQDNQFQSTTPYNHNWVDRYTVVLRHEHQFGDDWFVQAKGWYTHQEIDARSGANLTFTAAGVPVFPTSTLFAYEEFNNGGVDLRARHDWGQGTMFKGSTLTFGGVVYHGDAPFERYTLNAGNFGPNFLYAPRGSREDTILAGANIGPTLDQDRTADYQALFFEDLFRLGKFHLVGSFRLDHETVEVDSAHAPWLSPPLPAGSTLIGANSVDADHWIPMWGVGLGNDFGDRNETYFSASSGWRPTRFFDLAGTTRTIEPGHEPDPFESLDFELGVHGAPLRGFWYDVGLFWMEFQNRTESQNITTTEVIIVNSGNSRHRGFEGEISYDFLARFQHPPVPEPEQKTLSGKEVADKNVRVPGVSLADYHPLRLILFSNVQVLDAQFTESNVTITPTSTKTLVGNEPAFAPTLLWKGGISFRKERCFDITLSAIYSDEQFWADNNQPLIQGGVITVPAKIPSYYNLNLAAYYYITRNVRVMGGVSNLTDEKYYSRAFLNGLIEPAPRASGYAGVSIEF